MADEQLRQLELKAAWGDHDAVARVAAEQSRIAPGIRTGYIKMPSDKKANWLIHFPGSERIEIVEAYRLSEPYMPCFVRGMAIADNKAYFQLQSTERHQGDVPYPSQFISIDANGNKKNVDLGDAVGFVSIDNDLCHYSTLPPGNFRLRRGGEDITIVGWNWSSSGMLDGKLCLFGSDGNDLDYLTLENPLHLKTTKGPVYLEGGVASLLKCDHPLVGKSNSLFVTGLLAALPPESRLGRGVFEVTSPTHLAQYIDPEKRVRFHEVPLPLLEGILAAVKREK